MNKQYTYIAIAAALLASCSSQEAAQDDIVTTGDAQTGVYATLPDPNTISTGNDDTRSTLTYDNTERKMLFSWCEGDEVGVFPKIDVHSTQQKFIICEKLSDTRARFETENGVATLEKNQKYIAYMPYTKKAESYTSIPVTYTGQTATAFPKLALYYKGTDNNDEESMTAYEESEKLGSAHLSAYDLCASSATASESGACSFDFRRAGVITRFFFKSPQAIYYDKLQLVIQGTPSFTLTGTMNAEDLAITPKTTSHTIELAFNPVLDMTDETSDYYDYYNGKYTGYIVSYLMLAPIDLKADDDDVKVYVYLIGHDADNNKVYYKSQELEKTNLKANMFYQWRSTDNKADAAIVFEQVSVQDWETGTNYNNGTYGTGTEGW